MYSFHLAFILITGFSSGLAFAQETSKPSPLRVDTFRVGHNMSATSDTLGTGECSVGVQVIACGATDRLTIGTSPWLIKDYRMGSLGFRYLIKEETDGRWVLQENYFKSFYKRDVIANVEHDYEMEALWTMLVRSYYIDERYRLHLNFHANYYFNDKMPFSLRRPYVNRKPLQLNFTSLHEMNLYGSWFSFIEIGLVDLLNSPIHGQAGFSIGQKLGRFSYHVGFSTTSTIDGYFAPTKRIDYQQDLRWFADQGYNSTLDETKIKYDFAVHPEFSIQYIF